jgi:hypothetical protein
MCPQALRPHHETAKDNKSETSLEVPFGCHIIRKRAIRPNIAYPPQGGVEWLAKSPSLLPMRCMMTDRADESKDFARKHVVEMIATHRKEGHDISNSVDRTLIALSGGALVFSMTFVGQIAPAMRFLPALFCAWISFAASIITVVYAMRGAQTHCNTGLLAAIDLLNEVESTEPVTGSVMTVSFNASRNRKVSMFNNTAIVAFSVGVLLLGLFIGGNLMHNYWQLQTDNPTSKTIKAHAQPDNAIESEHDNTTESE